MMKSEQLFKQAQRVMPGGVNSPVRAFRSVGGSPLFFKQGQGPYVIDVEDKRYIDYVGAWGPLILGHCPASVVEAMTAVLHQGIIFGAPTEQEILLAEKIIQCMPAIEKIRMVNSGTEATMTAIRLARGFTRKSYIIKFNGCYHGHGDALLVKAGSGILTLGIPASAGVLPETVAQTLVAEFNHLEDVARFFEQHPHDIAGVIVEPIAGNMGMVLPQPGFLSGLRELCDQYHSLLIFDEVMTGFRVALGGAQSIYQVKPDLTTLGKIIGGGLPVGAIGGRADVMDALAPIGQVYQAGTLSGNPLAMAAGLATLTELEQPGFYEKLSEKTTRLMQGLKAAANTAQRPLQTVSMGGLFGFLFTAHPSITCLSDVATADEAYFKRFYHQMLHQGVYLAPSMYEAGFMSQAHQDSDIDATLTAAQAVFIQ